MSSFIRCNKCAMPAGVGEISNCVQIALETIRTHFQQYAKYGEDLMQENQLLKERNDKLTKAVDLLQLNQQANKKRKCATNSEQETLISDDSANNSLQSIDCTSTDVNMNVALSSEQFLNASTYSQEETIAETENIDPPRRINIRRGLLRQEKSDENNSPNATKWIGKAPSAVPLREKLITLSLNSNSCKKKQTKLKFSPKREKTANVTTTTAITKDAIDSTPNLYTRIKQAESNRSLSRYVSQEQTVSKSSKTPLRYLDDSDNDDYFFDFSPIKKATKTTNNNQSNADDSILYPIPKSNSQASVVMLAPLTQEVIFIDDTCGSPEKYNETLGLLSDLQKTDDNATLSNLKRYETNAIRELQKRANMEQASNRMNSVANPVLIGANIKNEDVSALENSDEITKFLEKPAFSGNEETETEDFPLPFIEVKKEIDQRNKKRSTIDDLEYCCDECESYCDYFREKLSTKQLNEYMRNCKKRKTRDALGHETPEGFWNPLMVSFEENDPRREILVDRRFEKKTQKK